MTCVYNIYPIFPSQIQCRKVLFSDWTARKRRNVIMCNGSLSTPLFQSSIGNL